MKYHLLFESYLNVYLQYAASCLIIYALLFRTPFYLGRAYFEFKCWIYFEKNTVAGYFALLHLGHKIDSDKLHLIKLRKMH